MQIKVNYDEVYQGSLNLKQKAAQYEDTIQNIYARMYEMQGIWQGSDNQAFIQQLENFKPQLKRMTQIIEEYANYLAKSATSYKEIQNDRIAKARCLV